MSRGVLERNNVSVTGSGNRALVFVHGFGCDQGMWRYIVPEFEPDYKVVLLDLVGAGNSDISAYDPVKYGLLNGYADDIIEVCQTLNLEQAILIGHSVSATIVGLASLRKPDYFAGLVMIGPSPRYINDGDYIGGFTQEEIDGLLSMMEENYESWSLALAPQIMGRSDHPAYGEELTESFCKTDPGIATHFASTTFLSDNRLDMERITLPTLLLQCSEDIIAPLTVGQYLASVISDNELKVLEATGHCPHLSAPQEVTAEIRNWLSRQFITT
ncbi:alpha/beta hydrolase [Lewinellaceae bacterium SD302]|nr:alpha/beta hydrolase [Lewinellaceae bacterium SD302]